MSERGKRERHRTGRKGVFQEWCRRFAACQLFLPLFQRRRLSANLCTPGGLRFRDGRFLFQTMRGGCERVSRMNEWKRKDLKATCLLLLTVFVAAGLLWLRAAGLQR